MARHRGMQAPINSVKHIVQRANVSIASGAVLNVVVVDALTKGATRSNVFDVDEGAIIKAVYVEAWIKSNAGAGTSAQQNLYFEKVPANANTMTHTESQNIQSYENKKNILYSSQGNLGDLTTQAVPVLRQWVAIPKGKQRMGFADRLVLTVASTGSTINLCGLFIYKEYY